MSNTSQPTILITGGTGFVGSHLVGYLLEKNLKQIHVTSFSPQSNFVSSLLPEKQVHQLDLQDKAATNELIKALQPIQIYHLASLSQVGDSFNQAEKIIINNTLLQLNLLEAVKNHAPKAKLLIIGSAQEYDLSGSKKDKNLVDEDWPLGPNNPYGVSKVTQDLLALSYFYSYGLGIIRVRPFNHIGERQAPGFAISDFAQRIAKIEPDQVGELRVGNLSAIRDFTDVKDMVKAYHLLMNKGQLGQVYNIGCGRGYKIESILEMLIKSSTAKIKVVIDKSKFRPLDTPQIIADNTKVKALGWQPTIPIEQTLDRILKYWRENI